MLIYKDKLLKYVRSWIDGFADELKNDYVLCVVSGGIDSCVNAAICSGLKHNLIIVFAGFKSEEDVFEDWVDNNIPSYKYTIIKPSHPEFDEYNLPGLDNIDIKPSMMLSYIDLYSRKYNALTVGSITKSENDMVKFYKNRIDTSYDCYPIIDLFRSEIKELGKYLKLPEEIINSKSLTEESFGYTYDELEWLAREDENLSIVSGVNDPSGNSKHWALYNIRNKAMFNDVFRMNKMSKNKSISKDKMCSIRKGMPGLVK